MAREWALAGVSADELQPEPHIEPPKTPQGKWENFWYHHKWKVAVGAFLLITLTVLTWQLATRNEPDYRLVVVTKTSVSDIACGYLETLLAPYAEDLDGDGKVEVMVENLYLESSGADYASATACSSKLTAYLASGDVMFFAMEPSYYEERIRPLLSDGYEFFTPLGTGDGVSDDGRMWDWKDSVLQKNIMLREIFPAELCFGVRTADGTAASKDSQAANESCLVLLKKLIADRGAASLKIPVSSPVSGSVSGTTTTTP